MKKKKAIYYSTSFHKDTELKLKDIEENRQKRGGLN